MSPWDVIVVIASGSAVAAGLITLIVLAARFTYRGDTTPPWDIPPPSGKTYGVPWDAPPPPDYEDHDK